MIKIYMENRLSLFSFHLWSLVLCSRTVIVWTMMSFHYGNIILKPGFYLVLQVWAFLFSTSMRSTNLNMKGKKQSMSSCNILRNCKRFYWIRFAWQKPHVLFPLLYSRLNSLISIFSKNIIYNFNFELFLFCFFPIELIEGKHNQCYKAREIRKRSNRCKNYSQKWAVLVESFPEAIQKMPLQTLGCEGKVSLPGPWVWSESLLKVFRVNLARIDISQKWQHGFRSHILPLLWDAGYLGMKKKTNL